ncbi:MULTISPECIES: DMT family transporter [Aneurinibacillus]|uniref:Multidrug resistance protein EbrB n=1 Tax=Aneurinibacillus danicus TaxID=267746 RepID=A0A511VB66_9BACL|nr:MULTISPECIES: multidrug efflux SMR transporter [Aneurinibacillus]GEN36177.1 multidrug resistance protein EbrB [Aneurinibacillus danicus]
MNGYVFLMIAILSEVFGTSMLKMSEGFSKLLPSLGVMAGFGSAFYFISLALQTLPLSMSYAIWSGIGTALTAIIGVVVWKEAFNLQILIGLILIIAGVMVLNFAKST